MCQEITHACCASYDSVFCVSPATSPTFSVSLGTVILFSRLPLALGALHPEPLMRQQELARIEIVEVISHAAPFVVAGVYGFPSSHPMVSMNDTLLLLLSPTTSMLSLTISLSLPLSPSLCLSCGDLA